MRVPVQLLGGGALFGIFLAGALLSLVWTPFEVTQLSIPDKLSPPGAPWVLGTDHLGRDMLSMLMTGARTSIAVAPGGGGDRRGDRRAAWADSCGKPRRSGRRSPDAVERSHLRISIAGHRHLDHRCFWPIGPQRHPGTSVFFNIPVFARVARGAALTVWPREFILAARVTGKGRLRISAEHILPNIANLLVVQGTIQFSLGILAEAGLSYVGLGAQPPTPSWGRMLADAQTFFYAYPRLAVLPGCAIVLTVLGLNLMGDGLRRTCLIRACAGRSDDRHRHSRTDHRRNRGPARCDIGPESGAHVGAGGRKRVGKVHDGAFGDWDFCRRGRDCRGVSLSMARI